MNTTQVNKSELLDGFCNKVMNLDVSINDGEGYCEEWNLIGNKNEEIDRVCNELTKEGKLSIVIDEYVQRSYDTVIDKWGYRYYVCLYMWLTNDTMKLVFEIMDREKL